MWDKVLHAPTIMQSFATFGVLGATLMVCLVGCAEADDVAASDQAFAAGDKPKKSECDALDKRVDACLDELGSIGGSLTDCMPEKTPLASACCKTHGTGFNFCRAPEPSPAPKPTKAECDRLDKRVDACLDELGSIGGNLDDCISKKDPQATACCAAHGKTFRFCR
jgi:hypothetical protein